MAGPSLGSFHPSTASLKPLKQEHLQEVYMSINNIMLKLCDCPCLYLCLYIKHIYIYMYIHAYTYV